jgi:ribosomal-protein-alanine N-acetyltransferase
MTKDKLDILHATDQEREWAAGVLSASDPWITLGRTFDQCLKTCYDPEYEIFVGHIDKVPVGFFILDPRGLAGSPYIKSIAIADEFRNRNFGAELLKYAEDIARKNSANMFLCVSSFNTRAQSFYENHGYHIVGELKDYIIKGASEIIMRKSL